MENTTVETPGTVALEPPSTVLNPETVKSTSGGGKVDISKGGESIQDVLHGELNRLKEADAAKDAKPEDGKEPDAKDAKPAKDEKADQAAKDDKAKPDKARGDDGKFAKADKPDDAPDDAKVDKGAPDKAAAERSAPEDNRQSEGRKYAEPPARFLPEARTKWANVPNEVKAEFHRISQEMETELGQSRDAVQGYEEIREYAEMAKSSNTTLKDALSRYVGIENLLRSSPAQGIATVLQNIGLTPQQYAEHVLKNPQAHQAPVHQQHAQPQQSPEIEALRQEIHEMRQERVYSERVAPLLHSFAAKHGDFENVWPAMQRILTSGVVDEVFGSGLSPEQKLEQAYRMAGGTTPSQSAPETVTERSEAARMPSKDAGMKSIRGAPEDGHDPATEPDNLSLEDTIRKELRKFKSA